MLNINHLPNPSLVKTLYQKYYKEGFIAPLVTSSHWRETGEKIQLRINDQGEVELFKGYGFGDMNLAVSNKVRIKDAVENFFYSLVLPQKKEFKTVLAASRRVVDTFGGRLSADMFRQLSDLSRVLWGLKGRSPGRIMFVGDGFGFLASVAKELFPSSRITMVDIGKVLVFQAINCQRVFPRLRHAFISEEGADNGGADFCYVPAENLSALKGSFDLFINIRSMQEMNSETVANYFSFFRNHAAQDNLFWCSNRKEKKLPGGEISRFYDFPWVPEDRHLYEGESVFNYFLTSQWPIVKPYDGLTAERLTCLAPASVAANSGGPNPKALN